MSYLGKASNDCACPLGQGDKKHTVMKRILFLFIIFLASCRSVSVVQEVRSSEVQKFRSVDTIVMRDSVFISERQRGDTVYLTRTEWRDRWRIREVHDTIHNTQYITQAIEHPPQRYVPNFYKWCTIFWFASLTLMVARWWLKRRV